MHPCICCPGLCRSDEYKPALISASINVQYVNVDRRALINNQPLATGASRYFNWIGSTHPHTQHTHQAMILSFGLYYSFMRSCAGPCRL